MSAYDSIITGLNEAIEYSKGAKKAKSSKWEIKEIPELSGEEIRRIRIASGYTQVAFALILGVTPKAVEAWECGRNKPEGSTRRMIGLLIEDPRIFEKYNVIKHEVSFSTAIVKETIVTTKTSSDRVVTPIVVTHSTQQERTTRIQQPIYCLT